MDDFRHISQLLNCTNYYPTGLRYEILPWDNSTGSATLGNFGLGGQYLASTTPQRVQINSIVPEDVVIKVVQFVLQSTANDINIIDITNEDFEILPNFINFISVNIEDTTLFVVWYDKN